jgi:hypothetical protein
VSDRIAFLAVAADGTRIKLTPIARLIIFSANIGTDHVPVVYGLKSGLPETRVATAMESMGESQWTNIEPRHHDHIGAECCPSTAGRGDRSSHSIITSQSLSVNAVAQLYVATLCTFCVMRKCLHWYGLWRLTFLFRRARILGSMPATRRKCDEAARQIDFPVRRSALRARPGALHSQLPLVKIVRQ